MNINNQPLPAWMADDFQQWSIVVIHASGDKVINGFTGLLSATDFGYRHLAALEWKIVQR